MEPIIINNNKNIYNNNDNNNILKQEELFKQLSLKEKKSIDDKKYSNLKLEELKKILDQDKSKRQLSIFEVSIISKLIEDKREEELVKRFESKQQQQQQQQSYHEFPPHILQEKGVFERLSKLKIEAAAALTSSNGLFNNQVSSKLNNNYAIYDGQNIPNRNSSSPDYVKVSIDTFIPDIKSGTMNLGLSTDPNNKIIIKKNDAYKDSYDYVAIYNYIGGKRKNYIDYWYSSKHATMIETGISRDKNRTYYVFYYSYVGGVEVILDYKIYQPDNLSVKLYGKLGEALRITWSNYQTSDNRNYVALHNSPTRVPQNSNLYIGSNYQYADRAGDYTTNLTNVGAYYYAVLWGIIDGGNFIRLDYDTNGAYNRQIAFCEVDNGWNQRDHYIACRISKPTKNDRGDYLIFADNSINQLGAYSYRNYAYIKDLINEGSYLCTTDCRFTEELDSMDYSNQYRFGYCTYDNEFENSALIDSSVVSLTEYEKWVTIHWDRLKSKKLRSLVLPGSHDAGTYKIDSSSTPSPDFPKFFTDIGYKYKVAKWSVTQSRRIYHQLLFGIRYFDIRVAPNKQDNGNLWVFHNLFSIPVSEVIDDVLLFTKSRPKEIIMLHFNHLQFLSESDHDMFINNIKNKLGQYLSPNKLTTNSLVSEFEGTPIILIYDERINQSVTHSNYSEFTREYFWKGESIISNYDENQYHDRESVVSFLRNEIKKDHSNSFWVLQAILTVNFDFAQNPYQLVADNLESWTKSEMFKFLDFFDELDESNVPLNIIMVDFTTFYGITQYAIRRNIK